MIKTNQTYWKLALLMALVMLLAACQPGRDQAMADEPRMLVTVSILPQAYFVERIGGEQVSVNVMVGLGEDPHTYEPKPEQMRALSGSQLFFTIGTEYEGAWLPRLREVNPEMTFVDSAEGIERIMETVSDTHDENEDQLDEVGDHDDDDEHADGLDPHVWLSPRNGRLIAANIYSALVAASPADEALFTANYEALIAEIEDLDQRISETLSGVTQRKFMIYHPAWGYFARDYDLIQLPIQIGGTDPSPSELAALIDQAREENIRVIFVQPAFSAANAQAVAAEINGEVATVDPLARDWLENLETAAAAFAAALGK